MNKKSTKSSKKIAAPLKPKAQRKPRVKKPVVAAPKAIAAPIPEPIKEEPVGVLIETLPEGAQFYHKGELFRKASAINNRTIVGVRLQLIPGCGGTLVAGSSSPLNPGERVEPKVQPYT